MASEPNNLPTEPEFVEFEFVEEPKWIWLKLKDGVEIELKLEITSIIKTGYDKNTGLPMYNIQSTPIMKLKHVPKEQIKKVQKPGPTGYQ